MGRGAWWAVVHGVAKSRTRLSDFTFHFHALDVEFSRQEYWIGLPFPTLRDLPDPGIKPGSPMSPALASILYHCATWEAHIHPVSHTNCSYKT